MNRKRNRLMRSSSLGEIGLLSNVQPIKTPASISRSRPVQWERPRRSILTLGSPPRDSDDVESDIDEGFGVFLRSCFFCRRTIIPDDDDVFMAGHLRAFCSESCRTSHLAPEMNEEGASSQPTQTTASSPCKKFNNS